MLTLPLLRKMLNRAGTELKANSKYLCELDSVAGDGDHGITIGRMADVMKEKTEDTTIDTMRGSCWMSWAKLLWVSTAAAPDRFGVRCLQGWPKESMIRLN